MHKAEQAQQHKWLQKFVGSWESDGEIIMEPGKPPLQTKGTEQTRALGDFWIITELTGSMGEGRFEGVMQVGYDPAKGEFIGSFIDNMGTHMWKYTGQMNDAGNAVVLRSEGSCPEQPGKIMQVRETLELVDDDHRRFTSEIQTDDGQWMQVVSVNASRRK